MFPSLPTSLYTVKPIKLSYLNPNRDFMSELSGTGNYQFQSELSAVEDFSIAFDSVNILTENRNVFSTNRTQSDFAVYLETLPAKNCDETQSSCSNYWVTAPVGSYTEGINECVLPTNILALKNNFTETHNTPCAPCYREYMGLNLGENGLDNLKPELLYVSNFDTRFVSKDVQNFTFSIPDWSDPISGIDLSNFICYGSIADDCPVYADNIKWVNSQGIETLSYFKGDSCSAGWVERYYDTDTLFSDTEINSNLILLSGVDYQYIRPNETEEAVIQQNLGNRNSLIFGFDCVSSDTIVDASLNNIDGTFTT